MLSGDREHRQDESIKLLFDAVAWLTAHTVSPGNPARDDVLRALRACAENPGPNEREALENALHSADRYWDTAGKVI